MYIYISAERSNLTKQENTQRTRSLMAKLIENGFNFEMVMGCYREEIAEKPTREVSFKVKTTNKQALEVLAKAYNQDAILVQEGRMGSLVDLINNRVEYIGVETIHKDEPTGCYTQYSNGLYMTFE